MKKLLIPILALLIASPAWSAQQNISTITTKTSREALRTAVNTELGKVQSNTTELYSLAIAAPWLAQGTAPSITNVFWVDTSGASPVIKYWDGDSWEVAAAGEGGTYTLPVATSSVLGGVKQGAGTSIAADGTISVTAAGIGLGTTDNAAFGSVNAAGGTLSAGVANTTQGTLVLYTNTDPIYGFSLAPAALPSATVSLKAPAAMPTADNSLLNFDINGTGGWTDPATLGGGYTNLTSFIAQTAWRLFYSDGSGDVKELALGSDGEYLKSNGLELAPSWATPSGAAHNAVTLDTETSAILSLSDQQITLDSQTANTFLAAPNGSAGDPTFRVIADADIPSAIARDTELPTDVTITTSAVSTNDATTSKHGWLMMATAPSAGLRNILAIDNAETGYKNAALFDATSPSTQASGDSAAVGSAMVAARRDHKHAMPTIISLSAANTWTATQSFAQINAGAAGFSVDADGDVTGKSFAATRTPSPQAVDLYEGTGGGDNKVTIAPSAALSADKSIVAEAILQTTDVDDTPINGVVDAPVSSNWAADHLTAADPHAGYVLESAASANGLSLIGAANYAAMRALLDLEVGIDFNAYGTIISGASPTVDAAGEVALDTTSDQFVYYGGAKRVLTYKKQFDFAIKTPVDADDVLIFKAQTAITVTDIHVIAQGGTSISVDIQECDSAGANCATVDAAITADTDGAEDDGTLSNGTIDAGDWVKIVLGAPSGTVNFLTGSIYYVETAD